LLIKKLHRALTNIKMASRKILIHISRFLWYI